MEGMQPVRLFETDKQEYPPVYTDEQIIDAAFKWYRERGFPYRDLSYQECLEEINALSQTGERGLLRTSTAYQVADSFHRHRFDSRANGMRSAIDAFNDDRLLLLSLKKALKYDGRISEGGLHCILRLVNGTHVASNFRPGFASYLYRKYAPENAVVLDTSTGYGGRLIGAIASQRVKLYIGIDPNTETHAANIRMAETLGFADRIELYNVPAEDLFPSVVEGRCDFAFTSPPYFSKEIYSVDATQSCNLYETGESWRDNFLLRMLELQYAALKPGCFNVVNIADVSIKGGKDRYPLVQWTRDYGAAVGFNFVESLDFLYTGLRFGEKPVDGEPTKVRSEPCLVFQKS